MRSAILALLAIVGLGLASSSSCFVNRLSERFTCTTSDDCDDGRTCDEGYCVDAPCPSQCSSCSLLAGTCQINCNANRQCGDIQCPAGFECDIRCNNSNACDDIDCTAAESCDIDCSGVGSCGAIRCGTGECQVECTGAGACPSIECATSCACEVACNNLAACPSMSCPLDTVCREGGVTGAPCDPNEDSDLCDTCP
jgi:hypothetical protein